MLLLVGITAFSFDVDGEQTGCGGGGGGGGGGARGDNFQRYVVVQVLEARRLRSFSLVTCSSVRLFTRGSKDRAIPMPGAVAR